MQHTWRIFGVSWRVSSVFPEQKDAKMDVRIWLKGMRDPTVVFQVIQGVCKKRLYRESKKRNDLKGFWRFNAVSQMLCFMSAFWIA